MRGLKMSEKYVSLAEVKSMLEAEESKREISQAQRSSLEHAQAIVKLSIDDTNKLIAEMKEFDFVTDFTAFKIADLLPRYPEDIRAIFAKERVTLDADNIKKIIDIVDKYL